MKFRVTKTVAFGEHSIVLYPGDVITDREQHGNPGYLPAWSGEYSDALAPCDDEAIRAYEALRGGRAAGTRINPATDIFTKAK